VDILFIIHSAVGLGNTSWLIRFWNNREINVVSRLFHCNHYLFCTKPLLIHFLISHLLILWGNYWREFTLRLICYWLLWSWVVSWWFHERQATIRLIAETIIFRMYHLWNINCNYGGEKNLYFSLDLTWDRTTSDNAANGDTVKGFWLYIQYCLFWWQQFWPLLAPVPPPTTNK